MTGSVTVIANPAEAYTRPSVSAASQQSESLAQRRTRSGGENDFRDRDFRDRDFRDYDSRDRDFRDRDFRDYDSRDRDFRDRDFRDYGSRDRDFRDRDFRELNNRSRRAPAPVPPLGVGPGRFDDSYSPFPGVAPPPLPPFPGAVPPPPLFLENRIENPLF
ncbi:MAG: hypothetical protein AAF282_07825 [Cyanobacteria bacterium P01_A01_bin.15]